MLEQHLSSGIVSAQDLASGYIFGEVLAKNNLQPDFDQFADSRAPAAVFNNYRRLQVDCTSTVV